MLLLGATAGAQSISIELSGNAFRIVGWTPPAAPPPGGWPSVMTVSVAAAAGAPANPPVLGTYAVENRTLIFRMQYPPAAGVRYQVSFRLPGDNKTIILGPFAGPPRSTTPTARVERVYPSGDVLPSNQLRIFVYFSAPMSRGTSAGRIHLLDGNGKELNAEFLPGEELWDPTGQRITLTFDPGRIKRGLTSNEKMGPPIADGQRYTLVIDKEWQDAKGAPMVEAFRKAFRGGPAMRVAPDPKMWKVTPPASGTSAPLVVTFDRPMNYPLLQRMIQVAGPRGNIAGKIEVARNETEWRFTPSAPWPAGAYRLVVDKGLEDLAGNSIGQPFDIDVFDRVTDHITTSTVAVPFAVR
jgi:hypothetical protein